MSIESAERSFAELLAAFGDLVVARSRGAGATWRGASVQTLVRRYRAAVRATARRYADDPDAVEDMCQEAFLRAFKALWTEDNPRLDGEFFRFHDLGFAPKPVQKPHPPIWVGGDSPGAFRRVVTLGDGWHATSKDPAQLAAALERLRAVADRHGRDMKTIAISVRYSLPDTLLAGGPQRAIDELAGYRRLGVSHVAIDFRRDDLPRMLELLELITGTIRPAVEKA